MDASIVDKLFKLQRQKYVFEDIIKTTYQAVLNHGDAVVDGGANVGDHTISMSRCVGPEGLVIAFEPVPATVEKLQKNIDAAGCSNTTIHTKALGAEPGRANFVWVENRATRSSLKTPNLTGDERVSTIDVDIVTLDDILLDQKRHVTFIKLDLEGGEFDCFRGARTTLARHKPVVVFENGSAQTAGKFNYDKAEFFALFKSQNYTLIDLFGRPYGEDAWGARNVPYYTFAVPSDGEIRYLVSNVADKAAADIAQSDL